MNAGAHPLADLGVDAVYFDRTVHSDRRAELIMKAQHIRLHSIYADLNHRELEPLVVQALRHGKTVEFLFADPASPHVKPDELQLALMGIDTAERITQDIERLKEIEQQRAEKDWDGRLEVRIHATPPTWAVYQYDDELYASPYLYRTEGGHTPCLYAYKKEIRGSIFEQFTRHVNVIWRNSSKTVVP